MSVETVIVNSLDSKCAQLEFEGHVAVAELWGVHLVIQESSDCAFINKKLTFL